MKTIFTIFFIFCITAIYAQPANDNPCTAISLTGNTTCTLQLFNNNGGTNSTGVPVPTCGGNTPGAQDVWFTVTVPPTGNVIITTAAGTLTNISMAIYTAATCIGPFTQVLCDENGSGSNMPGASLTGQTPGTVFYIRLWDYYTPGFFGIGADPRTQGTFSICFVSPPPTPFNDNPCQAVTLVPSSICNPVASSNVNALNSSGIPVPTCGGTSPGVQDVWFVLQVPASGAVTVSSSAGSLNKMGMAAYSAASCSGAFTQVGCNDGGGNMPTLSLTGLVAGSYIFIRMWDIYSAGFFGIGADPREQGTFSICAISSTAPITGGTAVVGSYNCATTPPAGNTCNVATPICTFDGYCGSTSGYSADYWYSGSQGLGGLLNANGIFCGSIENNSFISFIAGAASVQLQVVISGGSSCDEGVQFMMFGEPTGGPACGSMSIVNYGCSSPMAPGTNTFNASGLIPGQQYYLMIDGFAGDVCNYQINAISGVLVGMSAGPDKTICLGQSVDLSIFGAGTGTITWTGSFLNSTSGQTVTATPTAVGTYQYIVTAPTISPLCTGTATDKDTILVHVNSAAPVNITASACVGNDIVLTASGATNYTWSPPLNINLTSGSPVTVFPTGTTSYTVNGTTASGCLISNSIVVNSCNPILLSTELVSFEGRCQQQKNVLTWSTTKELDNSHFNIYGSIDGVLWNLLETVVGQGTTSNLTSYSSIDANPKANLMYYKLEQVDLSGLEKIERIIAVECPFVENNAVFQYVDSDNNLNIVFEAHKADEVHLAIYNMSGKLIYNIEENVQIGNNRLKIPLNALDLASGIYIIQAQNNWFSYHNKWIKE